MSISVTRKFGKVVAKQLSSDALSSDSISITKGTIEQDGTLTTAVTLNKNAGVITTESATTAAGASATFTVNNTQVSSTSVVVASICSYSGAGIPVVRVGSVSDNSFTLTLTNVHDSAALNAALKISFVVV